MKSVLFIRRLFQNEFNNKRRSLKSTVRAVHQPVDTLKYEARAGKREISPLAERAALRALNRALVLPRQVLVTTY